MEQNRILYAPGWALLVVDLQNDFADPDGSLYVGGGEEVVPLANAQIQRAQAANATVLYSQDWHPLHTPHFAQDGGVWPTHCVANTWGAEFVPTLTIEGPCIRKGTGGEDGYSVFSVRDLTTGAIASTELDRLLSLGGVHLIVLCGLATDYCIKETALDAVDLGYEVVVLIEGVRAVNLHPGDGERALDAMSAAGVSFR